MGSSTTDDRGLGPAPGRPRSFDTTVLIDRAVDVLWRKGFKGATTRQLSAELGVSQSSLYNAFGSKTKLQETALASYQERAAAALLEPLESDGAGLDALRTFLRDLTRWVTPGDRAGCMLINLMTDEPGSFREQTAAYRERVRDALHGALARAVRRGELADIDPEVHADVLFGQVLAINLISRTRDMRSVRRQFDAALRLLDDWSSRPDK